ncbi:hypothetical protein HPB50_002820 [Hyalomma asiaticum]|uniref:Uncharacterized protein n=1 Tax=Hyalomma asiaticum TaxID=266040 RepID=A0ACB7SBT2_HYAAI|nr:hypothetical protein HPB50_002820 [Hyalomma asiaticum]
MPLYKRYHDEPATIGDDGTSWQRIPGGPSSLVVSGESTLASNVGDTGGVGAKFGSCTLCLGVVLVTADKAVATSQDESAGSSYNSTSSNAGSTTSKSQPVSATNYKRAGSRRPEETTFQSPTSVSTKLTDTATSVPASATVMTPTTSRAQAVPITTAPVVEATTTPLKTPKIVPTNATTTTPVEMTPKSYECATRDCKAITTALVRMLRRQADPCRFYNTYACDASEVDFTLPQPSAQVAQIGPPNASWEGEISDKSAGTASALPKTTYGALKDLCLAYGDDDDADVGDALAFMSVLKLNLTGMRDNSDEDPLYRAMQLSLEFGVHSLLTFHRVFEYVVDASEPFRLEISVSKSVRDLAADWVQVNRDVWPKFFEYCLSFCGLHVGSPLSKSLRDELISLDAEVVDILSSRMDPATKEAYSESPSSFTFHELAAYTDNMVSADRWRQLLAEHGRAEFFVHESVLAYPRALRLAGLLSDPRRRLAMRRLLAWHLLLYLLGPKRAVIQAYQDAAYDAIKMPGHVLDTTLRRCEAMLVHTSGIRGVMLPFFDGTTNITYGRIAKAGNLMASVQNAAVLVLQSNGSSKTKRQTIVAHTTAFPQSAWSSGQFAPFWVLEELGAGFLRDWLSTLRSWHVLPPIVQAHLLLVAGVVPVDGYFYKYFQPPHFYEDGLAAYNFASLGQIVAHGLARHIVGDLPETYMERWDAYWAQNDMTSTNYMYCLHATNRSQEDMLTPAARLKEGTLKGSVLEHLVGTRLAFKAFADSPKASQDQLLPHVDLPPAVLFLVFHCAYSCRRGDSWRLYPRGEKCMVVFRWSSRFTELIPCGHDTHRQSRAQCRYL